AVYAGKEHDVTWRALPQGHAPYGFVDLSAAVYPRSDVAVYAATVLRAAQAQAVVFHFGASGATRVWLNGKLVHEDPAVHPSRFDQKSFAGELRAGDNFLLVKIAHNHGRLGFSLRVADAKDAPLVALAKAARVPQAKAPAFAAITEGGRIHPAPAKKPADAWDELRAAAAASPSDARAQEDLAVLLQWRRPTDDAERMPLRAMERVTDLVPTEPEAALRLARGGLAANWCREGAARPVARPPCRGLRLPAARPRRRGDRGAEAGPGAPVRRSRGARRPDLANARPRRPGRRVEAPR